MKLSSTSRCLLKLFNLRDCLLQNQTPRPEISAKSVWPAGGVKGLQGCRSHPRHGSCHLRPILTPSHVIMADGLAANVVDSLNQGVPSIVANQEPPNQRPTPSHPRIQGPAANKASHPEDRPGNEGFGQVCCLRCARGMQANGSCTSIRVS